MLSGFTPYARPEGQSPLVPRTSYGFSADEVDTDTGDVPDPTTLMARGSNRRTGRSNARATGSRRTDAKRPPDSSTNSAIAAMENKIDMLVAQARSDRERIGKLELQLESLSSFVYLGLNGLNDKLASLLKQNASDAADTSSMNSSSAAKASPYMATSASSPRRSSLDERLVGANSVV